MWRIFFFNLYQGRKEGKWIANKRRGGGYVPVILQSKDDKTHYEGSSCYVQSESLQRDNNSMKVGGKWEIHSLQQRKDEERSFKALGRIFPKGFPLDLPLLLSWFPRAPDLFANSPDEILIFILFTETPVFIIRHLRPDPPPNERRKISLFANAVEKFLFHPFCNLFCNRRGTFISISLNWMK